METVKREVIHTIEKMSDAATLEEIMYRLFVLDKISKGRDAVKQGKVITVDELKKEMRQW